MEKVKQMTWTAPEFVQYQKGRTWFLVIAGVGVLLVGYYLIRKDFLTSVMFLLLFGLFLYLSRAKPREITVVLSAQGLRLNETVLPFNQVKTFWIVYQPPEVKTLNFETTAYLNRNWTVQLVDQDPVAVREFLLEYLPEDHNREEPVSDQISRTLKF